MGTVRLGKRTEGRSPHIKDFVPLASLDDVVFGGWDIFEDNCYEAAKTAGVIDPALLDQIKPGARSHQADVRRSSTAATSSGSTARTSSAAPTSASSPISCATTSAASRRTNKLDRLVMIWCGSTEVYLTESERTRRSRRSRRRSRPTTRRFRRA